MNKPLLLSRTRNQYPSAKLGLKLLLQVVEEEESVNQFHRLPDNVIVHIFEILSDVNCLCRCSAVCNRFATLVPLVHTVSIPSTSWIPCTNFDSLPRNRSRKREDSRARSFLAKLFKPLTDKFVSKPCRHLRLILKLWKFIRCFSKIFRYFRFTATPFRSSPFPVLEFLDGMKQIRSLHIELPSSAVAGGRELFKWGAKFSGNINSVTVLSQISLHDINNFVDGRVTLTGEENADPAFIILDCMMDALVRLAVLLRVLSQHLMLQNVVISDSNKHGTKFWLSGSKLVEFRNSAILSRLLLLRKRHKTQMRLGLLPVLSPPESWHDMKGVMVIIQMTMFDDDDFDGNMALLDAFDGVEDVFSEAAVQITRHDQFLPFFSRSI